MHARFACWNARSRSFQVRVRASVPLHPNNIPKHAASHQLFASRHAPYLHTGLGQGESRPPRCCSPPRCCTGATPAAAAAAAAPQNRELVFNRNILIITKNELITKPASFYTTEVGEHTLKSNFANSTAGARGLIKQVQRDFSIYFEWICLLS